jgi:hypothetical protein
VAGVTARYATTIEAGAPWRDARPPAVFPHERRPLVVLEQQSRGHLQDAPAGFVRLPERFADRWAGVFHTSS